MSAVRVNRFLQRIITVTFILLAISSGFWYPLNQKPTPELYARQYQFNFLFWEIDAVWNQALTASLNPTSQLTVQQQREVIDEYLTLVERSRELERSISENLANPDSELLADDTRSLQKDLGANETALFYHKRLAESVLQHQITQAISSLGLAQLGTAFPPLLFRTTDLPKQLIVSPRETIRQEESISLQHDITIDEIIALEDQIEKDFDLSALVVNVGGVGTYPTMVIETTSLRNLIETVSHEWIHNYLTLRPLGVRYGKNSALRTMNETTANIAGEEITQAVFHMFYPDLLEKSPLVPDTVFASSNPAAPENTEEFSFSREMYNTRVRVDALLEEGKIEQAEKYMETRREFFWENGYAIRKLNQAYFAFHGAYADVPFSAAGRDPVGENVRLLRTRHPSLASFIRSISQMRSYEELVAAARAF